MAERYHSHQEKMASEGGGFRGRGRGGRFGGGGRDRDGFGFDGGDLSGRGFGGGGGGGRRRDKDRDYASGWWSCVVFMMLVLRCASEVIFVLCNTSEV